MTWRLDIGDGNGPKVPDWKWHEVSTLLLFFVVVAWIEYFIYFQTPQQNLKLKFVLIFENIQLHPFLFYTICFVRLKLHYVNNYSTVHKPTTIKYKYYNCYSVIFLKLGWTQLVTYIFGSGHKGKGVGNYECSALIIKTRDQTKPNDAQQRAE